MTTRPFDYWPEVHPWVTRRRLERQAANAVPTFQDIARWVVLGTVIWWGSVTAIMAAGRAAWAALH